MRLLTGAGPGILVLMLLAGCFRQVPGDSGATTMNDGRDLVLPLSGLNHTTEGTASLRFELPGDAGYQLVSSSNGTADTVVRTWQAESDDGDCVVIAGEQPDFSGAFPASAIATFQAGLEPGGTVEQNEAVDPVPGTVAGVAQRSRYPTDDGPPGTLIVRQYLTDDSTLVSLNIAGPVSAIESCRLEEIAGTLQVEGANS